MEYRIVKKDAFRIVGVRTHNPADAEESFKQIPLFWDDVKKRGVIPQIAGLMNAEPMGILGVCTCAEGCTCKFENGTCVCEGDLSECYYYIAAGSDKPVPEGMFEFTVPECTWAIFPGSGSPLSIQDLQKRIFAEWLPTSGYEWANAPDVEVYLNDDPVNMKYEVWMPVEKKFAAKL
jgi:AraC family transcriptional regulator